MAQPKWITTNSSLGTIVELEYYEFPLDAYDPTGGGLTFSLVSGRLPLGLQIISTGKIQGIPVSELAGDAIVSYRFTVRVKNSDKQVADRTFSISITNIAPPIITPKNIDLGTYFDGTVIDVQLQAIEATPSATLTWKLIDGTLPKGLTLLPNGKLLGYLQSNSAPGPGSDPGWDDTAWDLVVPGEQLGWDFPLDLVSQQYTFTIQVYDGVFTDVSTYQLLIFPRQDLVASNAFSADFNGDAITADSTSIRSNFDFTSLNITSYPFTVTETDKHYPIILTTQDDLIPVRQDSYYAFQFTAFDVDNDVLKFGIATATNTGFDELNIGYDTTKFSQSELSIPGGQIIKSTTYTALGSSGTTFKVADTTGLYPGLLVTMDLGLGGNRKIINVLDNTTIILSSSPEGVPSDGDKVLISNASQLTLDENTGWFIGRLPAQTLNEVVYDFEIIVYKRDDTSYESRQLYQLTVIGDLNDTINWVTPSDLGTIENGAISEFYVEAKSTTNKFLSYTLTPTGKKRMPQGLQLTANGLIYGKVSFEVFFLDSGATTIDGGLTTLDLKYEFSITASNLGGSLSASQIFTIQIVPRTVAPYENLYLKALPNQLAKDQIMDIIHDQTIFDPTLIYRSNDPYFGLAKDIKFLFLPGLEATDISTYMQGVDTNHFKKRLTFGSIKTAIALDDNFNIRYEVVYLEINDPASNATKGSAADIIDLTKIITNPYYDFNGTSYTIAYPNGFNNMTNSISSVVNFTNKGALPGWMTSNQPGPGTSFISPLGLTHGLVLAYTVPGASNKIAYRLSLKNINFNTINFTVDRYQLDNIYSENYNTVTKKYIKSYETTFDRLISTSELFTDKGLVDYAVSTLFERLNGMTVYEIQQNGGMDGILDFVDGEHIVFYQQEYQMPFDQFDYGINLDDTIGYINDYNHGWNNVIDVWDNPSWAYNIDTLDNDNTDPTLDPTPGEPWNYTIYVPGYNEHIIDTNVINERAGIWRINIEDNFVTLTFVSAMEYFDKVNVRNGHTQSGNTIFFDPTIKDGQQVPTYSQLIQNVTNISTTFDNNGTRFLSNRDMPVVPGENNKYIKFAKINVFT